MPVGGLAGDQPHDIGLAEALRVQFPWELAFLAWGLAMKILALCKAARLKVLLGAVQIAHASATSWEREANTVWWCPG